MKTYSPRPRDIERRWYVIDASGAVLGRLASEAAAILRGKHKPIFAPHMDTGDHVIVVNAKEVQLTGGKLKTKVAYRHSGYPGGLSETRYDKLLAEKPAYAVEKAIKGMLPHNRLGRQMAGKLKVYAGPTHRHQAQQPQPLRLGEVPRWEGLPAPLAPVPEPEASAVKAAERSTGRRAAAAEPAGAPKRTTARRTGAKAPTKATGARTKTSAPPAKGSPAKKTTARRAKRET
jgi:large subunit ribosomal protein L13